MTKIQRVKKVQMWSAWKIAIVAALLAVCADAIMFCSIWLSKSAFSSRAEMPTLILAVCLMCLIFLLPASVAIRYHPRFRNWWHGFLFGATYGLMSVIGLSLLQVIQLYMRFGRFPSVLVLIRRTAKPTCFLVALCGGLFVLLWTVSRKSRGKLLITDKTYCPNCGYNLLGNTTYICPECGRSFTLEELEINSEDLQPHGQE